MRLHLSLIAVLAALAALVGLPGTGSTASADGPPPGDGAPTAVTHFVYVRPVTAAGRPVRGWTVEREPGRVDCSGPSPSAVNPDIVSCYPTVMSLRACWKSADHTVLCVRDAREHTLVRVHYTGRFPSVDAPAEPAPMNLALTHADRCLIRNGGAWGAPPEHPRWIGFYSCEGDGSVYAPPRSRDGIDRSEALWSVRLWRSRRDDIVRRDVRTVYYVGTAAA